MTQSRLSLVVAVLLAAQVPTTPPRVLPAPAVQTLNASLAAARAHAAHLWRDTLPFAEGGLVDAVVEIPLGERRKWEFDMRANALKIDRVIPESVGGYPINYGFVPQTVSYDGDPFDALVLGPALTRGRVVRGAIVGLMLMEDEKGLDSKVVLSPIGADRRPLYALDDPIRSRVTDYFNRYKQHEPGKFSRVPGWGSPSEARAYIDVTHAFFRACRNRGAGACRIP